MSKNSTPPVWASKLLSFWAGNAEIEDLKGDLEEEYLLNAAQKSIRHAQFRYIRQVMSICFSYALRRRKSHASYSPYAAANNYSMYLNYFKIAIRNFNKHKLFTSLNIIGLALGMSICLLALSISVAIYTSDENHALKDRIYQINTAIEDDSDSKTFASTFPALSNYLKENFPFIERVIPIRSDFRPTIDHFGNPIDFRGYYVGDAFLETFDFQMIYGNPKTALDNPNSVVLTKSSAEKLFRDSNPLGQVLETKSGKYVVSGVIADVEQTHFFFEILASHKSIADNQTNTNLSSDWTNYRDNYLYVLLQEGAGSDALDEALEKASSVAGNFHENASVELASIGLTGVVPRWNISNALGIGWDQPSMLFFMFIGVLILLPAIFNYINLSIARALKRSKEIGIRKVVGAAKSQVKAQFIVETIILTLLALFGSILIYVPMKEEFLDMVYAANVLNTSPGILQSFVFLLFAVTVGILAGVFPAKYFAGLSPLHTLKGQVSNRKISISGVKKGLFVFQFFVSLVFVIGVGTIARQYAYVLNKNHGFTSDNVLAIPFKGIDKQIALNEMQNHPDVKSVTTSSSLPGILISNEQLVTPNLVDTIPVKEVFIGDQFIEQMNMKLLWGESNSLKASNQNEEHVLVNEEYLKAISVFNTKSDSLRFTLADGTKCKIIGVLKNFNYEPLSRVIQPIMMRYSIRNSQYALLTINTTDIKNTINELDAIWSGINQKIHFEPKFLDDEIEGAYYFLAVQIKFFSFLSALAITISCLGLLGMVSFTTENRTKEIAIRKILGADNKCLYYLLTRDFVKLILLAAAIAVPFSYFFYDKLFLYFLIRYGLGLGWLEVVGGIGFLFMVGFLSIYWQTHKIAKANPATNLRYE